MFGSLPEVLEVPVQAPVMRSAPLIAAAFYQARYIEHVGSGIEDVEVACAEAGLPQTTVDVRNRTIIHTIWRKTTKETGKTSKKTTKEGEATSKKTSKKTKQVFLLPDGLSDAARKIAETMLSNPRISARPQPASLPRRCRLLDLAPSHGTQFPTEVSIHSLGEAALMPLHLVGPARRAGRRLTGNDAFQAAYADSRGGGRACRGQNGGARRPAEPPGWAVAPRPPPPPTNH